MSSKVLITVVGPTAIGKTRLAIALAQHFKTEILSADSRQFYKEMRIGTAVPSPEELSTVKHHFIQHKSVLEQYTVGDFEREAIEKLVLLFKTKDVAIMVGGSGLYTDAVVDGLDEFPEVDPKIREGLIKELNSNGIKSLQVKLKELDEVYYQKVDLENSHRVIRALEICIGSGKAYSSFLNQKKSKRSFRTIYIGLAADREIIYDRINQRVDIMMNVGLLEEVKSLYQHKNLNTLQTVGYRELFSFIDGKWSLEKAIEEIKKNTRRFAKRQLTWYRKNSNIFWIDSDLKQQEMIVKVEKHLKAVVNE
ncbi:tRNA (adenosine(37)-N6)-dimethylallyltransferase MiaA [Croceitalea sp. MTPC9]|uniref:tRNA (adenosine(37)-N6)-dimethylallyltransferase MiaA n=1 Tax=unclassified Croceitalea TaxID=2632280 RepID=UPI002B37EAA7|nr:tRNA (adenosine(37)-N6)-dimethylallyltransferase MiaA [Croceitalea sp. MTPC6]GMN15502.1 tRNA (adenosine(37)-N6)-dimethylallyltransferase MiaA [Croceitalea sp. MTPC9]